LFPDRRWSEWSYGRPIKSHHIVKVLREYRIEPKAVRLPDNAGLMWGFSRAALDETFSRYLSLPHPYTQGGQKSDSRPYNTENVEENDENENPNRSAGSAPKNNGDASNSAGFEGVGEDESAASDVPSEDDLTHPHSPFGEPGDQKHPHTPHEDIPKGATGRRRKGV
jgi:hypothetical protein